MLRARGIHDTLMTLVAIALALLTGLAVSGVLDAGDGADSARTTPQSNPPPTQRESPLARLHEALRRPDNAAEHAAPAGHSGEQP